MNKKPTFTKEELKMPQEHFGAHELLDDSPSYFGIIISVLIVALMCILGGLYAWSEILQKDINLPMLQTPTQRPTAEQNNEPESANAEATVETLGALSTSDEIDAIEADLESTLLSNETLDADLQAVEAELAQ